MTCVVFMGLFLENFKQKATRRGLEPLNRAPKALVLPLHYRVNRVNCNTKKKKYKGGRGNFRGYPTLIQTSGLLQGKTSISRTVQS